ncbi:MAG: O-antigen ligase family protein [Wenzhouxiangella sp.]
MSKTPDTSVRRRRRSVADSTPARRAGFSLSDGALLVMIGLVLALPLMMGNRTPETLSATALLLVGGSFLAVLIAALPGQRQPLQAPPLSWGIYLGIFTLAIVLQVWPSRTLAQWFGPYPEAFWLVAEFEPRHWSPHVAATLRGWAVGMALLAIAWLAGSLNPRQRGWLWLAIVAMALFQALYGLISHAAGSETIFGIWERHNDRFVHGSFSNRNLFAGYLALTWPLAVAVWWMRDVPLLKKLPRELSVTGSVISGAIIGAALMGSASRLGSVAGLIGMVTALLLWTRYRHYLKDVAVWPAWLAAFAAFLFAVWYGLAPLTDRLAISSAEEHRTIAYRLMMFELPLAYWLSGVGLGAFEAVFKQVQTAQISGWWDYAHSDLLQWLLEMGLAGWLLIGMVIAGIVRHAALRMERLPLYSGLVALCVVGLGDFSWHIPGTQVVLAIYIGVLLRPAASRRSPTVQKRVVKRRRRSRSGHDLHPDLTANR